MLLLDTQAVLWLVDDSPRLGAHTREVISSASVTHFSAATLWELNTKAMLGKLTIPDDLSAKLPAQGLTPLNITPEHGEAIREFPELTRHDPLHRMLVAQAYEERLTLVTADEVLLELERNFLMDARK